MIVHRFRNPIFGLHDRKLKLLALIMYVINTRFVDAQQTDAAHEGTPILELKTDGDLIIGGLFPIHEDGSSKQRHCGDLKPDKGVQRMESMIWAIERINKEAKLLPGIKLGMHILDTCHQDTHGLEQTLEFIKTTMSANNQDAQSSSCHDDQKSKSNKPIVAVIGAANSEVSKMVANVLRLFQIPQISYSSTSSDLSDKSRFEYFSRVVPPDDLQAAAMVDIVEKLKWKYVSAIADEGAYGDAAMEEFQRIARERKICIATHEKIKRNFDDQAFSELVTKLSKLEAKGIVMFINEENVKKLLEAIRKLNLKGHFHFVASDSWGNKISAILQNPEIANNAITVAPEMNKVKAFDRYFMNLKPQTHMKKNPWFKEFWMHVFKCTEFDEKCLAQKMTSKNYGQEMYVPFVIEAVYLLAHAINATITQHCFGKPFHQCSLSERFNGSELLFYIRNVTAYGPGGKENTIQLDHKGDRKGKYVIYQYRAKESAKKGYHQVGTWSDDVDKDDLNLTAHLVAMANNETNSTYRLIWNETAAKMGYPNKSFPVSECGRECPKGQWKKMWRDECCWHCQECNASSIMPNDTSCSECWMDMLPDPIYKNVCVPMTPQTMEWLSLWSIIPCCFSCIGIIATLFVAYVFVKHSKTPVIMASGRELCYMMLAGIVLAYMMTFVLLHPPTNITCGMQRLGLGTTLSIVYASILTKTSRLARIFTSNVRSMQRPKFISPRAQVVICSLLISGQLVGAMIWITVEAPQTMWVYPNRMVAVLSCKATATPILLSLTYILLLICLCTIYAFKTRKIPENFNETKHIGFTMYATCIIWLAFVPIYFGTVDNFKIQITSMCMCISISATVALACFFAPKVYIVLFQPNKNVRPAGNMSSLQKLQIGMVQQQMRFLRPKGEGESTVPTSVGSQYSTAIGGKSTMSASTNGDLHRLEESSTSFIQTGGSQVSKRRRSSVLKQILPQSESRHNRVGTISIMNSQNNNFNNNLPTSNARRESAVKPKNTNVNMACGNTVAASGLSSSISSSSSVSSQKKNSIAPVMDDPRNLRASYASIDGSKLVSKSASNQSSIREHLDDGMDEFDVSPRRSMDMTADRNTRTSRSISVSDASLIGVSPNPPVHVQQATPEDDEEETTATDLLLNSPSTPIAWTVADPRSEFELILTEISSQEGTFV